MVMKLNNVVPFGRSLDEYRHLFHLGEKDLCKKILSVADGPASFNAEMVERGMIVHSVDPIYVFDRDEIRDRFFEVVDEIIDQVKQSMEDWVWHYHASAEELRHHRTRVLEKFLSDYPAGLQEGRYIPARLPVLPFRDNSFDLALCSHFLFLYSDHLSLDFHVRAIWELLRVANEVRIFPLLTLNGEPSGYLESIREKIRDWGCSARVVEVNYELQRGGNKALFIERV
jgi:hypothetical protein